MDRGEHVPTPRGRNTGHIQQRVTVGDRSADIDSGLIPLVEALWQLDIDTTFSCEGTTAQGPDLPPRGEPWGYLSFPTADDFTRFLDLFAGTELAERRFRTDRNHRTATTPSWELAVQVRRNAEDVELDDGTVRLTARVGFASSDIEALTRIVTASAERHAVEMSRDQQFHGG